ncbi:MAG: hypothetical protein R6U57_05385 [Anaerolineales bacterium]
MMDSTSFLIILLERAGMNGGGGQGRMSGEWVRGFGSQEVARQQDFLCQALVALYSA